MGDVTFVIGNGFDLKIGLRTTYNDFYEEYIQQGPNDSEIIKYFKKEILINRENWKDFERSLGEVSQKFGDAEDFIDCHDDFVKVFDQYLVSECNTIDWSQIGRNELFIQSIAKFYSFIRSVNPDKIKSVAESAGMKVNFLQFNYTNVFDILLERSQYWGINGLRKGESVHVHGQMDAGYSVLGVNDISQIKNENFRTNNDILSIFVKQIFLDVLQSRNVNRDIPRKAALEAINSSDIICAFGSSIGETDKFWWEKIGERLNKEEETYLIIFDKCDLNENEGRSSKAFIENEKKLEERKCEIIDRFVNLAGLDSEWTNINPDRVIVELNSDMFNFELPFKGSRKTNDLVIID